MPASIPTMITPIEASYLRWLTQEEWTGRGDVVEFGPWLGGSTWCLASGMATNEDRNPSTRLIAVDDFVWRDFFDVRAGRSLAAGESFEDWFSSNLAQFDFVEAVRARLPDEDAREVHFASPSDVSDASVPLFEASGLESSIGLVFVDSAKSWPGTVHLLREVVPRCERDALWTWQDFKLGGAYWVQLAVGWLLDRRGDCLDLVDVVEFNSVTFRATAQLDADLVAEIPADLGVIDADEGCRLIEAAAALLADAGDPAGARLVELSTVGFLADRGDIEAATARYRELERRWPLRKIARPLHAVGDALAQSLGTSRPRTAKGRLAALYHATARRL